MLLLKWLRKSCEAFLLVSWLTFFTPNREKMACDLRSLPAVFLRDMFQMPLWDLLALFGHVTNHALPGHPSPLGFICQNQKVGDAFSRTHPLVD